MLKPDKNKIDELLERGVAEIIDKENLRKKLSGKKKLRIKLGIDPTSPNLHLGRAVALLKLRDFQEMGHKVIFIIGDFTGVIGDTSDKESERPMLDSKTVKSNLKSYVGQAGRILDIKKVEIRYNSQWLTKLKYEEIARQANVFSLSDFIDRENIKRRLEAGKRVSLREVLYPLMQGYDSVAVRADVELGGTDQKFNLLAGREIQRYHNQKPQDILMVNLIEGTDGRKMSSSWGNVININDKPSDVFGKIMRLEDGLIIKYFIHCTRLPLSDVSRYEIQLKQGANPRNIKMILAYEITKLYCGEKEAQKANDYFISAFQKKEVPTGIKSLKVKRGSGYFEALLASGQFKSKSELTRLFDQGAVKMIEPRLKIIGRQETAFASVIKVGKRTFFKIEIK